MSHLNNIAISLQVIGLLDVFTPDTSFDKFQDV